MALNPSNSSNGIAGIERVKYLHWFRR